VGKLLANTEYARIESQQQQQEEEEKILALSSGIIFERRGETTHEG
jgi:hypothetical protein